MGGPPQQAPGNGCLDPQSDASHLVSHNSFIIEFSFSSDEASGQSPFGGNGHELLFFYKYRHMLSDLASRNARSNKS